MKKLTAGIFATLLAVVSTGAANAEIASKGYVDEQVDTVEATVATKADQSALDTLTGRVSTNEGNITALQTGKLDTEGTAAKATADADGNVITTTYATKTELNAAEKIANRVTTVSDASDNTHYPTAKAVWDVVQAETEGIASTADLTELEGRVDTAEGDIDTLQSDVSGLKTTKADKTELGNYATTEALTSGLAGKLDTEGTAAKATADASGNVITTTYATKTELGAKANTADLGALATKNAVSATEIDANAVTTEKILDANVTKAKLASDVQTSLGKADSALQKAAADEAYAVKSTETTASTAASNAQKALTDIGTKSELTTSNKNNLVGAINELDAAMEGMATNETIQGIQTDLTELEGKVATNTTNIGTNTTHIGTVGNLSTTAKADLVSAVNEVKTQADKGVSDAAAAKSAADAAQATADGAIPKPDGECSNPTNKCVLTWNNSAYAWEVIERGAGGE